MERQNSCACRCLMIPGFCFKPSDEELVGYFLREKIAGRPLCCIHSIAEFKIYHDNLMPWEILKDEDSHWITYSNDSLDTIKKTIYVFTELCKKNTRVMRRSGGGSWKGQNTSFVKNVTGDDIGYKKLLTFYEDDDNNKGKKQITYEGHGHWIMNEYSLLGIDNYVVCKITKEVEITPQAPSCSSTKADVAKQEFHSHCQQKKVELPFPDVIIVADTNLQPDVEDMNRVLGDEMQLGDSDHDDQPLDESGADWDNNGWQTELDNELGLDISADTRAEVFEDLPRLARMNEPPQVQSARNFHLEDKAGAVVQELAVTVCEKKYELCKGLDGAANYDVIEILDDDSVQELPLIGVSDDPPKILPISVGDQAENRRVCTNNIPDSLSNFLNYMAEMDGIVSVQETPVVAWEDLAGSTVINPISNDFSNFEHGGAALAVEPTNPTLDGLDVMLDIPFYDILNLGGAETNQQISHIFEEQPRKRMMNDVDDYEKFSSRKKARYI